MKLKLFVLLAIPFLATAQPSSVNIIPAPVQLMLKNGNFVLDKSVSVQFQASSKELRQAGTFFIHAVNNLSGMEMPVNAVSAKSIRFVIGKYDEIGNEGYLLNVSSDKVEIEANTRAGIIYGIQTMLQTLPPIRTNAELSIPCMYIKDYPRFAWRGMHLDVSRHFFGTDIIREYIDLMAAYKMNTFHWHLVDDQGWRIEIKKYPLLTKVGAWRVDHTDKAWDARPQAVPGERAAYGGYYTQEQLKELVQYAAERNVTIVPEIEMPGHVASAIASYPYLSCNQLPQLPLTGGNYTNVSSNYCAGNDSVFTFLENVLSEVMNLFPSTYIHIGGDEVDKIPWKNCSKCQARIKKEGLHNEEELQSYFIRRIEKYLTSKGRRMIGWDEILEGGLAPDATVMSWRGERGGIEAARMEHGVVMTPGTPCYFNHYQAGPEGEPRANGGFNSLKKVYEYEPVPAELDATASPYVLGAQGNLWTEYISTAEHLEYMVLPRMLALAEVVWSPKQSRNWENFNERLQPHFRTFEQRGLHYCRGNFTVNLKPVSDKGKVTVVLSNEILNSDIYYTTDASNPTAHSKKYTDPITLDSTAVIKAVTVQNNIVMGLAFAEQKFVFHKATGKAVHYTNPVSNYYQADGPNSLTDGIRGNYTIGRYWHGFNGKDFIATIDLGETTTIQTISLGCLQKYVDWIFLPQWVMVEASADGVSFTELQTVQNPVSINQRECIQDFKISVPPLYARYIRITAKNNRCPPGHSGEGKPGWIFADEIIVH